MGPARSNLDRLKRPFPSREDPAASRENPAAGAVQQHPPSSAARRFRYQVYVEELGRYRSSADHDRRVLIEPEDRHSILYGIEDDTGVVGTLRASFGGDGFSPRQISQYSLHPFLAEVPAGLMAIGVRLMVAPQLRGTPAAADMRALMGDDIAARGTRIVFGDCEPHLLSLNLSMGCMPYAERNINSDEAGYLIPVVSFVGGTEGLLEALGAHTIADLPGVIQRVLQGGAMRSTTASRGATSCGAPAAIGY